MHPPNGSHLHTRTAEVFLSGTTLARSGREERIVRVLNIIGAAALAAAFPIVTAAAGQTTTDKTKVEIKDGKDVTVAGCLDRTTEGRFVLTTAESGSLKYVLVTDDDLGKYVGHEVEVKGKAADRGNAKVKIEEKVKTDHEDRPDTEARSETELKGHLPDLHYLGVKSVKRLSDRCD
jgi:hypothetical protein